MIRFLTWLRDILLSVLNGLAKTVAFLILLIVVRPQGLFSFKGR